MATKKNTVHPRLAELSAAHSAMLKAAKKAKADAFRRVSSSSGGRKLEEGEEFVGVFLGTVNDGKYTNHRFASEVDGETQEVLLKGVTVINEACAGEDIEPGKTVMRIKRTGSKKTKGGRTCFLYDIGILG